MNDGFIVKYDEKNAVYQDGILHKIYQNKYNKKKCKR